jgi:hypothetical protein
MQRCLSTAYPAKASPPLSSSKQQLPALLQTINCRKAWSKQLTGTEQGFPCLTVWYEIYTTAKPTQQPTGANLQNKQCFPTIQLPYA